MYWPAYYSLTYKNHRLSTSNHFTSLALSKKQLLWQAVKDPAASHARLLLNDGMKAAVTHGATKCMAGPLGWLMGTMQ